MTRSRKKTAFFQPPDEQTKTRRRSQSRDRSQSLEPPKVTKSKTSARSKSAPPGKRTSGRKNAFKDSDKDKQNLDRSEIDFMERNIVKFSDEDIAIIIKLLKAKCPDAIIRGGSDSVDKNYARVITTVKNDKRVYIPGDTPDEDIIIIDCNKMDMKSKIWLFQLQYTYNHRDDRRANIPVFNEGCLSKLNPTSGTNSTSYAIVFMSSTTEKLFQVKASSSRKENVIMLKACTISTDCYRIPAKDKNICTICGIIGDGSGSEARDMLARLYLSGVLNKEDFNQLIGLLLQKCPQVISDHLGVYIQHSQMKLHFEAGVPKQRGVSVVNTVVDQNEGKVVMFYEIPPSVTSSIWESIVDDLEPANAFTTFKKKQSFGEQNRLLSTTDEDDNAERYYKKAQEIINSSSVLVMAKDDTHFGILDVSTWKLVKTKYKSKGGQYFFKHCSKTCMKDTHGRCGACASKNSTIEDMEKELAKRISLLSDKKQIAAKELSSDKYYEQMADSILEWILTLPPNNEWPTKFLEHLSQDDRYKNLPLQDAIVKACKSVHVKRRLPWAGMIRGEAAGVLDDDEMDDDEMEESNQDEFNGDYEYESDDTLLSDAYETDEEADHALSSNEKVGPADRTRSTRTKEKRFVHDNEDDESDDTTDDDEKSLDDDDEEGSDEEDEESSYDDNSKE